MLFEGDCLDILPQLAENSVDAVVTDPPYGLAFMGKHWDYDVPSVEIWKECLRVLKPGGYLLSFAGTRTYHRIACAIEDAGFEIRDMVDWVYGSGFPKSLNIGKAVDKLQGNERDDLGVHPNARETLGSINICKKNGSGRLTKGTSEWEGWGTALKPAHEPICMARKPLSEKTVAENVLKWGTGGINIDGCRVGFDNYDRTDYIEKRVGYKDGFEHNQKSPVGKADNTYGNRDTSGEIFNKLGRFPANFIHDGSQEVLDLFPNTKSKGHWSYKLPNDGGLYKLGLNNMEDAGYANDSGSAARFFYCAKASKAERNMGCEELEPKRHADRIIDDGVGGDNPRNRTNTPKQNFHPTVKPVALMEYLIKLVSREDATILDPFAGSGTTGIACKNLNRNFILIERDKEYSEIARNRVQGHSGHQCSASL